MVWSIIIITDHVCGGVATQCPDTCCWQVYEKGMAIIRKLTLHMYCKKGARIRVEQVPWHLFELYCIPKSDCSIKAYLSQKVKNDCSIKRYTINLF